MIRNFFRNNLKRFIIVFIVSLLICVLYLGINNAWNYIHFYIDAFTISGLLIILIGGLILVSGFGGFYIFSYYAGRQRKENGKKETYGDYSARKQSTEKATKLSSIPYFIVGFFMLLVAIILLIIVG